MDTALAALLLITVLFYGVLTFSETYFTAQDRLLVATQEREARTDTRARTALTLVGIETQSAGAIIEITLRNVGTTKLADFDQWDVLIQYYTAADVYVTAWFPYVESALPGEMPGNNQWTVKGIYGNATDAIPEVYEPGILNPTEELVIQVKVAPEVGANTTNLATIAAPNGVSLSAVFVP